MTTTSPDAEDNTAAQDDADGNTDTTVHGDADGSVVHAQTATRVNCASNGNPKQCDRLCEPEWP